MNHDIANIIRSGQMNKRNVQFTTQFMSWE